MKRFGWTLATILAAALLAGACSVKPWQKFRTQLALRDEALAESKEIERQRVDLLSRNARLDSPFGMEEQARRLGYRKPYERPLAID